MTHEEEMDKPKNLADSIESSACALIVRLNEAIATGDVGDIVGLTQALKNLIEPLEKSRRLEAMNRAWPMIESALSVLMTHRWRSSPDPGD